MKEFKEEMRVNAHRRDKEMKEFKNEMREFKNEMKANAELKDKEMKESKKDWNKRWGDLSRKLGTIVEDIIYPGIIPLIKKLFKEEPYNCGIRLKRKKGALREEFDIVAVLKKYVIMVEVKSKPNHNDIFSIEDKVVNFRQLFTEYADKEVLPVLASLTMGQDVINLCTKHGIYALAYKEWDYLDILNFDKLSLSHKKKRKRTST